jgi:hypothetical protein
MRPPDDDLTLALQYGITFTIAQKAEHGQAWQTVAANIPSLGQAFTQAQHLRAWEVQIATTQGFQYWSSRTPDLFNSTVIARGVMRQRKLASFEMIQWHAFLDVRSPRKAEKLLERLGQALSRSLTLQMCTPYWKDARLFEALFTSPLNAPDIVQATFTTLHMCQQIAGTWQITGPQEFSNDIWELHGSTVQTLISGIAMVDFTLSNIVTEWSGL